MKDNIYLEYSCIDMWYVTSINKVFKIFETNTKILEDNIVRDKTQNNETGEGNKERIYEQLFWSKA